jgi:starvation-inducible DNA-binding protein
MRLVRDDKIDWTSAIDTYRRFQEMASATTLLPELRQRGEVASDLQALMVELIDLALHAKQAHWNVEGPLFKPLHEQFDEIAEMARHWTDIAAERLTAIGVSPDGRPETVVSQANLEGWPTGPTNNHESVALITARLATIAERTRARMDRMGAQDAASQDFVIEILQGLEKQLWMMRVQMTSTGP